MVAQKAAGILIKSRTGNFANRLAVTGWNVEPLMPSVDAVSRPGGLGVGVAPAPAWLRISQPGMGRSEAWAECHAQAARQFGVAGAAAQDIEFAEPDLEQVWHWTVDPGAGLAVSCDAEGPNPSYPAGDGLLWHMGENYSQFRAALERAPQPAMNGPVRVAHLDTGYDPGHATLADGLERELQRSFVGGEDQTDASDKTDGLLTQRGHGTATMALLAGRGIDNGPAIGAAPFVKVVPLRVANRVVLFRTSAIAKALNYVHELHTRQATPVHVVTMSMGGLASQAWADAINALYEAGVFVVTAAGNNFDNAPTRFIVFPARFQRVVAACGVMADHRPYADLAFNLMAGNYGPPHKMATALAACTPNTPWARLGCPETVDRSGGGTSSATPQVAAAAALWVRYRRDAYEAYPEPWQRVEAIRAALFGTAQPGATDLDAERLGHGMLRSDAALAQAPAAFAR